MHAYVYLRAEPAKLDDVVVELAGKHGVRHVVSVTGDWDVLIAVEGPDFESVARTIKREILSISGVVRTSTTPVVPLDMLGIHGGMATGYPLYRESEHCCYVHVRVEAGRVASAVEQLTELEGVGGIAVVAGPYDLLVEVPLAWEQASRVILEGIHGIGGVVATSTAISVPMFGEDDEPQLDPSSWG